MRVIDAAVALRVLEFIRDADPKGKEVAIDEFAYDRMVENYREAAIAALDTAVDTETTAEDIKETLMKRPQVKRVEVERVDEYRVQVEIDSEPWVPEPRYEVYDIETDLMRKYPKIGFDFHLINLRERDLDA